MKSVFAAAGLALAMAVAGPAFAQGPLGDAAVATAAMQHAPAVAGSAGVQRSPFSAITPNLPSIPFLVNFVAITTQYPFIPCYNCVNGRPGSFGLGYVTSELFGGYAYTYVINVTNLNYTGSCNKVSFAVTQGSKVLDSGTFTTSTITIGPRHGFFFAVNRPKPNGTGMVTVFMKVFCAGGKTASGSATAYND